MSSSNLTKRVEKLETVDASEPLNVFMWPRMTPLCDALASAGLTLDDKPLMALRLVGVAPGGGVAPDPIHERDRHLLG